jgi:voltage-gated potassium channel
MKSASRRIVRGVAILVVTMVIGIIGYLWDDFSLVDAIYMVVITVFGVGFGEVHELDAGMRVFTIGLIVCGCSSLIYILGGFFQMLAEGELNRALGLRRMTKDIENIKDHVIICGFGRIGRVLATELQAEDVRFVVIDTAEERRAAASEQRHLVLGGDATSDETLLRAGIERARALVTALPNDALNVFITLTARHLNPKLLIVARGEDHATEEKLLRAGASRVVLPSAIGAERMAQMITRPGMQQFFEKRDMMAVTQELATVGLAVREVPVSERMIGRTVADLENSGTGGFLVLSILRIGGSTVQNPKPDLVLAEEDRLLLLGHQGGLPDVERMLGERERWSSRSGHGR